MVRGAGQGNSPHTRGGHSQAEQSENRGQGGRPRQQPAAPGHRHQQGQAIRCPETRPTEGPGHEGNASPTSIDQPQVRAKETARTPGAGTPKATKAKGAGKGGAFGDIQQPQDAANNMAEPRRLHLGPLGTDGRDHRARDRPMRGYSPRAYETQENNSEDPCGAEAKGAKHRQKHTCAPREEKTWTPSKTASRDIDSCDGPEEVKSFSKGSNVQRGERWHRFPPACTPSIRRASHQWPSIPPNRQAKQSAKPAMPWPTKLQSLALLYAGRCTSRNNKGIGTKRALHITV
ncbi:hypothetical protein V6N12_016220 [Hibiscus sabdariffa]|uniref:Uncharacterized protein n=1 Tax=Hibiscus sabdariffa TaxID=183260 RepID=A0ABR2C922_9ROSI